MAVDGRFGYGTLYEQACHVLQPDDVKLFGYLATQDFEMVLRHLRSASFICGQLGDISGQGSIALRQKSVRSAMVAAIQGIHPEWSEVGSDRISMIGDELMEFESVFTTSYDLLLYWAINSRQESFTDHFRRDDNDLVFNEGRGPASRKSVCWVHGGLHMYVEDGRTYKTAATRDLRVLDRIENGPGIPNIVAEGDYRQKVKMIFSSSYLSACYSALRRDNESFDSGVSSGNVVVLGHRLGESDKHLAEALRDRNGWVAYGVHYSSAGERVNTVDRIVSLAKEFKWKGVSFFDSAEHPLILAARGEAGA